MIVAMKLKTKLIKIFEPDCTWLNLKCGFVNHQLDIYQFLKLF